MKALILHGVSGFAGKHWMQWLHDELIQLKFEVIMPTLPNSDDPNFLDWREIILNLIHNIEPSELIIFGHSLGVPAALNVIQDLENPVKALFSVSGFYEDYGSEINTKYMQQCLIDIHKAKGNIQNAVVFYGDNDPYVPQNILSNLAIGLKVDPIIIENGGHLNTEAGYTKFPLLIEKVKELTKA